MIFVYIFLALAVYGAVIGKLGGALIALFLAGFSLWAQRQLDKIDAEYNKDPRNAKPAERATSDELDEHECECWRDRL